MILRTSAPFGVPHRETGTELVGPRHQVELVGEPAVIALGRLGQHLEVGLQLLLGGPGGAVDALEHRAGDVAAPVGARHRLEREVPEPPGGRHVGAGAHVAEGALVGHVAVGVVADGVGTADLAGVVAVARPAGDPVDDLGLVHVVGEELGTASSAASSWRTNGWSAATISCMRSSMRSRSSSVMVSPSAAARRSRSRARSGVRSRAGCRATGRRPPGPARGRWSGGWCAGPARSPR